MMDLLLSCKLYIVFKTYFYQDLIMGSWFRLLRDIAGTNSQLTTIRDKMSWVTSHFRLGNTSSSVLHKNSLFSNKNPLHHRAMWMCSSNFSDSTNYQYRCEEDVGGGGGRGGQEGVLKWVVTLTIHLSTNKMRGGSESGIDSGNSTFQ